MKIISKSLLLGTLIVGVIIAGCSTEISTSSDSNDENYSNKQEQYKIVFASRMDRLGTAEIYIMNADGTNQLRLTNNSIDDRKPSFSPDGSKILFISASSYPNHKIFVMNSDGTNQHELADNAAEYLYNKY